MKERDRRRTSRRADNAAYAGISREYRRKLVLASSSRVELDPDHFVEAERRNVRVPRSLRDESRVACYENYVDFAAVVGFCAEPYRDPFDSSYRHPRAKRRGVL